MHFYNGDVINEELPGNRSCRQFSLYLPPGHHRCTPPCILWYIRGRVVNIEWVRIESGYCLEKYVKGCVKTFNFHLQVNWPSKWPIIFFFMKSLWILCKTSHKFTIKFTTAYCGQTLVGALSYQKRICRS